MKRYRRLHPGIALKRTVFDHGGIDINEAAKKLGVTHTSLLRVLSGQECISPELSTSLEKASISDAKLWNKLQANYNSQLQRTR